MFKEMIMSLQKEIVLVLMSVLVAIVLIGGSYLYWQSLSEEKDRSEIGFRNITNKYNSARDRKRIIDDFENKFSELLQKGIIGNEKRLSWIETIESVVRNNQLSFIKYKINKQEMLNDKQLSAQFPGIDIYVSTMSLNMQLLHEGDLFALMSALNKKADGLFEVSECKIRRNRQSNQGPIEESGTDQNFNADCILNWYTFRAKGA